VNPRVRGLLRLFILLAVVLALVLIFPKVFAFAQMSARSLLHLWWLVLLVALAAWLIWGIGKRPPQ
jgi:hypothetical protein